MSGLPCSAGQVVTGLSPLRWTGRRAPAPRAIRASAVLSALAFVAALLVAWTHPIEPHLPACHDEGATHVDAGHAPEHHDALGCSLCLLAHAATQAPDLSPAAPRPIATPVDDQRLELRVPDGSVALAHAPRAPPV